MTAATSCPSGLAGPVYPKFGCAMMFSKPQALCGRTEALSRGSPIPAVPGIYAWFFNEIPPGVPTQGCVEHDGRWLLYIGISPANPRKDGGKPSTQTLRKRIRGHYRGDASRSTLRFTLGCLLSDSLGIELQRINDRLQFGSGERRLSDWMEEHAFVAWEKHEAPWIIEHDMIAKYSLPLNLAGNRHHAFFSYLKNIRAEARKQISASG